MPKFGSQGEEPRSSRSLSVGQVATGLGVILGLISVSHNLFFSRSEGKDLGDQIKTIQLQTREDLREIRTEIHDLTKALLSRGKLSAKSGETSAQKSGRVASVPLSTKERRRQIAQEFYLNSFGEDVRNDPFAQNPLGKSRR